MADFQTRIEDLVGQVETTYGSASADTAFITQAMTNAVHELINMMPAEMLHNFTQTSSEITSNGAANPNMKILSVQRETGVNGDFTECKEVPLTYETKAKDVNSMFAATKQNPVFIRKDAKIYVYPAPGASPNVFVYTYVNYPGSIAYNASAIGTFPDELEYAAVLNAAIRCQYKKIAQINTEIKDATDKAKTLSTDDAAFNALSTVTDDVTHTSALYWLGDEDPEMVTGALNIISTELSRAQALIGVKQSMERDLLNLGGLYKSAVQAVIPQIPQQAGGE